MQDEFGENESRFDGLAETDVVGEQQGNPRHAERFEERDELEVFGLDGSEERRGNASPVAGVRSFSGEERRHGGSSGGADECVEVARGHGRLVFDSGEGKGREESAPVLTLPNDRVFGRALGVGVLDADEVDTPVGPHPTGRRR